MINKLDKNREYTRAELLQIFAPGQSSTADALIMSYLRDGQLSRQTKNNGLSWIYKRN